MAKGDKAGGGGKATTERPQAAVSPAEEALDFKENEVQSNTWGVANYAEWWNALSEEEQGMLMRYQANAHESLNAYLRGLPYSSMMSESELKRRQALIDGALAKGRLGRDLIVYRGVEDVTEVYGWSAKDMVGKTIHDKGFVSTSLNIGVARDEFAQNPTDAVTFRIKVPKGSRGGYLGSLASQSASAEREFLMPRGQRYRVTKVTKTSKGYLADAEVY